MAIILIVDDRPTNRQFLLTLLGYGGHRLLEAANGAEALERVRAERPDLVITDILMPTMDGYEFVAHLRADPDLAPMPVIFYTATYSEPQAKALADSCGVRIVLPKPCDPERILAAVNEVLGTAGSAPASSAAATQDARRAGEPHRVDDKLAEYVNDLQSVKSKFDDIVEGSVKLRTKRDQVRQLSEQFSENVMSLQRIASRLSAIIEVGMEMTAERNPARLVELFFAAACDIIDSKYAAIGMLDEQERALRFIYSKGVEASVFQDAGDGRAGILKALLEGHRPLHSRSAEAAADGLPPGHPRVRNFLGVPVASKERVYGWLFFADKRGEGEFTEEDERLAGMMAAKLAVLYENAVLYDVIQRHAAQLQVEIAERRRAEQAVRESEAKFRELIEQASDGIFVTDERGNFKLVNPRFCEMLGYSEDALLRLGAVDTYADEERALFAQRIADLGEIKSRLFERMMWRKDGTLFPIEVSVRRLSSGLNQGIVRDITERKRAEDKIRHLNRVYAVLSGINTLIVRARDRDELFRESCTIAVEAGQFPMAWIGLVDRETTRVKPVAWGGGAEQFLASAPLSMSANRAAGRGMSGTAISEKKAMIANDIQKDSRTQMKEQCKERGINSLTFLPLIVGDEGIGVLALYASETGFFDEEEMKLLLELAGDISFALDHLGKEEKLNYLAYYDALTGLANATLFRDRVDQHVHDAGPAQRKLAVMLLDVDRFKTINDSLGRNAGDEVLKDIGKRMLQYCSDPGHLARINADRFAMVMPGVNTEQEVARRVEEQLRGCFGEPYRVGGAELRIASKVGIALFPSDGADAETLFKNAEAALKKAKASGERYLFYAQQMTERIAERLALESKLRQALERQEFVLHYQPKFDAETKRIEGVEALIRWQSPELGLVPPMQFIPLLEETGLIFEAGAWALRQAAFDYRRWQKLGLAAPRVAVNVSAVQLRRRDFVESVRNVLGEGPGAAAIDVEITESLVMEDIQANTEKLEALRLLGVNIAIDDFGTGYSSLAYLAKLPVQELKIDRSFIITMLKDRAVMTLVSTVISMAHSLGLKVVAEGVDAEEQAKELKRLGCDRLQGYLYSKPVDFDAITFLLGKSKGVD